MKKKHTLKNYIYFLLAFLLIGINQPVNAQEKINLSLSNMTLEDAIKRIESSTKYTFFYDATKTDLTQKVSVNAQNKTIREILNSLLQTTNLTYEIEQNQIALILKPADNKGQSIQIAGVVVDETGEPVIGANVSQKNTTNGTITDFNGEFTLNIPENAILVFSYVGYISQEVTARKGQALKIKLAENTTLLGDVVVIGYGSIKKSDATGAVEVIKASDFNKGISSSPESLLNGHIAGVNVAPSSGQPRAGASVRIRGVNSISASSEPLYVIDGVPIENTRAKGAVASNDAGLNSMAMNPLSMIAASDIESMTVLKDASATAIYGSRGANGVIIINTKGGKEGVTSLNYAGSVGFSNVSKKLDILSADEFRQYVPGANPNVSTDWQDEIFRTALVQEHNISLSSGNKNTSYRASLNAATQDGIIINTGLDRYTLRFNVNHKMFDDRLIININANNTHYKRQNILEQQTGGANGGIINNALKANPTQPVYKEDGSFNEYATTSVRNPVAIAKQNTDKTKGNRFIGNADATIFILPKVLSVKANLGYDIDNSLRKVYQPRTSPIAEQVQGRAITENTRYSSHLFESYVTFDKTFNEIHGLNVVGGYSWQEFDNYVESNMVEGFISDNLGADNQAGGISKTPNNLQEKNRLISFYGRANYNLMNRYLLTATLRNDGSSRFGQNNRWALFPSAALAWKVNEEAFMKNQRIFDDLKLRVGFGITGNQDIGNFRYSQTYGVSSVEGTYFNQTVYPAYTITGIANPNLKWEETAQWNLGVDFAFLGNKLKGSVELYSKKTSNLLLTIDAIQPAVSSSYLDNIGSMTNKGIEFTLNAALYSTGDFDWNANFNIAYNKNKITELYNGKDIIYGTVSGSGASGNTQILRVGESIGSFYGQKFTGIENGSEKFESSERTIIGNALPDYTLGLTNSFSYKNWDLSFVFRSQLGMDIYNNTRAELSQGSRLPGQNTNKEGAEFYKNGGEGIVYTSSRWVENGSFLRLDNMTLGYNFKVFPNVIKSARVYATAQNLFVITKYKGYDPEVNNDSGTNGVNAIGIDYCSYPHARTFTFGINLNF